MENTNQSKNGLVIAGSIIVAGVIIAVALIYAVGSGNGGNVDDNKDNPDNNTVVAQVGDAPVLGEEKAPVTMIEFGDFQCPACNVFYQQIEPLLRENYINTGKAKMAFKTLTFIDSFDGSKDPKESFLAGSAGECAKEQGKFWAMHDAIYQAEKKEMDLETSSENNGNLDKDFFLKTAKDLELDENKFLSCFSDSSKHLKTFEDNMGEADELMGGRVSTPTLFINGKMIQGVSQWSDYQKAIDEALAKTN
ncbi:MAG: thioredoxin domain-containing protein [Candidatus Paceibacterota bacterium]|jgi:protein-disulfide isomerase